MICKKCGHDNAPLKRCCSNCGAFLEGYTINNVTGKYGYRGSDGQFYDNEEEYHRAQEKCNFVRAIQVGDNVTDIMKLPCIFSAWKYPIRRNLQDKFPLRGHYPDKGDIVYDLRQGVYTDYAMKGDWLCENRAGVWFVLSNEEYSKIKEGSQP